MAGAAATALGSKFLRPSLRPKIQPADVQAAAMWGVAAGTTALWIVQVSLSLNTNLQCMLIHGLVPYSLVSFLVDRSRILSVIRNFFCFSCGYLELFCSDV
ncbi:hypothetical protein RHMOL_Rhmol09G0245000 [Rhododendron molle]|uniref:Uncharacterized protein n=1 Tax=Rhododendron molle TaxID=49168 RepID=A0ACC0MI26_RHOML|nr:hypothetical protein RHMOL_Rhmol09G0245000 [Rhododendron molle]